MTAAIWGVKHGTSHDNFGYFEFSGTLTWKTTNFRRINFCYFFTHLMYAKSSVNCCKILKFLTSGFRDNCPQKVNFWSNLTSLTFCSEGIFRAIMCMSQIGGRATQRGQNVKWTKVHIFKPQYLPNRGPIPPIQKSFFSEPPISQRPQWVKIKSGPKLYLMMGSYPMILQLLAALNAEMKK